MNSNACFGVISPRLIFSLIPILVLCPVVKFLCGFVCADISETLHLLSEMLELSDVDLCNIVVLTEGDVRTILMEDGNLNSEGNTETLGTAMRVARTDGEDKTVFVGHLGEAISDPRFFNDLHGYIIPCLGLVCKIFLANLDNSRIGLPLTHEFTHRDFFVEVDIFPDASLPGHERISRAQSPCIGHVEGLGEDALIGLTKLDGVELSVFHACIIPHLEELVNLLPVFFCGFLEVPLRTPIVYASALLSIELGCASPCLSSIPLHIGIYNALGIGPVIAVLI
jgi:hypothetical protein